MLSKKFRSLIRDKDYFGAIDFVVETFKLNKGLEDKYDGYLLKNPPNFDGMVNSSL